MVLKKLLKLIVKKGKKTIAMKNMTKTLQSMRSYIAPSRVEKILKRLMPSVKIYKKKVAGKVYQLPWRTTKTRSVFQAAKWIMLGIEAEKKGEDLSKKIGKQIVQTLKGKGVPLKLRGQFLEIIKENRSYMRFIRRKRTKKKKFKGKVKRKGKFKNKFTKRTLRESIREIIIKNKKKPAFFIDFDKQKDKDNDKKYSKKIITKNKKHRR